MHSDTDDPTKLTAVKKADNGPVSKAETFVAGVVDEFKHIF
jgi:hypothetical protein